MNKRQLEVEKAKLAAEARELKELKAIYDQAAKDIQKKISISNGKIEILLQNWDDLTDEEKSIYQSQIYQRKFQQSLKQQIDDFTSALVVGQYESINDYMRNCYEVGFIGAMYDLHGQGIPLVMPIDEDKVVRALRTNSKISKKLYTKLGEDVDLLKKKIASSLSRGIATADSYANIARNIANDSNVGFNRAMRIARTEGHRIQANSAFDAQLAAEDAGADIVKQWDAALDGKTRPHHRQLDGQIRELDEPFEVAGMTAMYPSDFGRASEDVNCRCALLQRAKWALDEDELETLKERAAYFELDKSKTFDDYKKKYQKASSGRTDYDLSDVRRPERPKKSDFDDFDEYQEARDKYRANLDDYHKKIEQAVAEETHKQRKFTTKEQVLEWAKKRNVVVKDEVFNNVDMRAISDYIETTDKLFDKYPQVLNFYDEINSQYWLDISPDSSAVADAAGGFRFGKRFSNVEDVLTYELESITEGFKVFGDGTPAGLYRHEFGHTLDDAIRRGLKNAEQGVEYNTDLKKLLNKKGVSEYAHETNAETFAEAFAAYESGSDTEFARAFGDFLDKWMHKKPLANAGKSSTIKLQADINKMITPYEKKVLDAVPKKEGYFDFAAHGSADNIEYESRDKKMTAREVARIIRHNELYNGEKVRLLSCSTGATEDGFAQQLANALGVEVEAPSDVLIVAPDGTFKIGYDGSGKMLTFKPEKRK